MFLTSFELSSNGGINTPGFMLGAFDDPLGEVRGRVLDSARADRAPRAEVGEVGTDRALRGCAPNGVATRAGLFHERDLALGCRLAVGGRRRELHARQPAVEVGDRLHDHDEAHARVLDPAELRALADVRARSLRREPQDVVLAGYEVDLARELRHPEAVDHVVGIEMDLHRPARGQVDLVGRRVLRPGIADRPPPALADDLDLERVRLGLAQFGSRLHGHDCEHAENDHRNDDPAPHDPRVVAHRAFALLVAAAAHDRPDDEERDDRVHGRAQPEHEPPDAGDAFGFGSVRVQDRRRAVTAAGRDETRRDDQHARAAPVHCVPSSKAVTVFCPRRKGRAER